MEGVLVGVQLAPQAVVCLIHPLINTEDFSDGLVLDNRGVVGHDLLTDPDRVFIARATIPADGVVMAGPLTLKQGGTNTPIVKEAFIARLAINMPGYSINLDGVDYPCWGFAVILLNWAALKEKSGIDEMFQREGLEYRLTRTDVKIDSLTGESFEEVGSEEVLSRWGWGRGQPKLPISFSSILSQMFNQLPSFNKNTTQIR